MSLDMDEDVKKGFKYSMGKDLYEFTKTIIGIIVVFVLMIVLSILGMLSK